MMSYQASFSLQTQADIVKFSRILPQQSQQLLSLLLVRTLMDSLHFLFIGKHFESGGVIWIGKGLGQLGNDLV